MNITTVGLDADDTLWHNETIFRLTHARFVDLLDDHGDAATIEARLAETEQRNLRLYGYGVKGFTLSMIETAMELCDGGAPPEVVREILAAGREMLAHPVETLPGVDAVVTELSEKYRLVLITKGDLLDQERKLAASGLGDRFSGGRDRLGKGSRHLRPRLRPPRHRRGRGRHGRQLHEVRRPARHRRRRLRCPHPLPRHLGPRTGRCSGRRAPLRLPRPHRRTPRLDRGDRGVTPQA
jgi:hypothetical protein